MPSLQLFPGKGTGSFIAGLPLRIRLSRKGCANRPFYHLVLQEKRRVHYDEVIEQLGSYDPIANERNEKLIALNFERLLYWIGNGAEVTRPVSEILGIAGFFPVHPRSYMTAWRNRMKLEQQKLQESTNGEDSATSSTSEKQEVTNFN